MSFAVTWMPQAIRNLEKLPREVAQRVIEKVAGLSEDPFTKTQKLSARPEWRLRVGNYRVLLDISVEKKDITILTVDHRSNVYKW